jgi:hypothetical protein
VPKRFGVQLPKGVAKHVILWLFVIPIAGFTAAMIIWPEHAAKIFAIEVASPIPPLP